MGINLSLSAKLFSLSGLTLGLTSTLLFLILVAYGKTKSHKIWALFNLSVAWWGFGSLFMGLSDNAPQALFVTKIAYPGVLFVPVFFYHFSCIFSEINRKFLITFAYLQAIFFSLLSVLTNGVPFISHVERIGTSSMFYIRSTGLLYNISFVIWLSLVAMGFIETLLRYFKEPIGIRRNQLRYLFTGFFLGFTGGLSNFMPVYGINGVPLGNFTIPFYSIISTYAILRYKLLDIKIVITRVGVFVFVYSILLGIPFWLGIKYLGFGPWIIPTGTCAVLATVCPFIFLHIQRKAEAALLQEEKRIQDLLSRVSVGMRTIRDLSKLSELIVDILMKHLRLDNAAIYLYNTETAKYVAKVSDPERVNNTKFGKDAPLVRHLEETKYPVVYEEVKLLSDSEQDGNKVLREIAGQMAELQASVVVPAMSDNFLLGFIVLGERKDKRLYSVDLINVLSVLGNQAALAIENCHYIQRMQAEGLAERMISLDHMASSMAHEIDNPMHIIRTSLSFVKSALLRDPRVAMPEEIKQDFDESLARSLNASERVSSMIKAILDYSRMGTGKLESIRVSDALEGFLQLIQPQIREERVQFAKEIENDLPPVLGDRVQMEEVFMNFVRNSLHAVRRKEEKKITLKIFRKNETIIRIECADNGYGIPGEIINDIFLSSMTTKGSTEGTGLGLFRVRKIVDIFRGKVWAESEGKGKGATFIVELPVYGGHKSNTNGD